MLRKKLTTILGIASIVCLAVHLALGAGLFTGLVTWSPVISVTGRILVTCFVAHAVLALVGVARNWARTRGESTYPQVSLVEPAQTISGIVLVALSIVHGRIGSIYFVSMTPMVVVSYLVTNVLLYAAFCVHVGIAAPHVLVSLGITRSDEGYQRAKAVAAVLAGIVFVLLVASSFVLAIGGARS